MSSLAGWTKGVLADIAIVNPPVSFTGFDKNTQVTFLGMADVSDDAKIITTHERLLGDVRNGFTRFVEGDVLFAKITPCMENGKGAIARNLKNGIGFGSTEFHVLRAKPCCCSNFVYQHTISKELRVKAEQNMTDSAGQRRVPSTFFREYEIAIPPDAEQRKIAKILSTVDNLIEKTQALIDKYQSIKQGMMHDLFTRGVDENGHLRPSYEEAPHLYKESGLGWIPKEWEVALLDSVTLRGSGHTPSKSNPAYWNGGIKWVSLADSSKLDKLLISETDKEISELGLANSSAVKHPAGTVVLSRDAGIGKSAILAEEMAVSQHFMAWRCGDRLNNSYLYYWLQIRKPVFEAIAMGSTIKTIGLSYFKKMKIALPLKQEQEVIANTLLTLERKLSVLSSERDKYQAVKSGLMQDLLTGKVRVKVDA